MLDAVAGKIEEAHRIAAGLVEPLAQPDDGRLQHGLAAIEHNLGIESEAVEQMGDQLGVTGGIVQPALAIGTVADHQRDARRGRLGGRRPVRTVIAEEP